MYLVSEDCLAEWFGRPAPSAPAHTVTHLQRKWLQALPAVNRFAVQAARLCCCSYRNFHVGGAAFCYSSATGKFLIVNSGNLKLFEGLPKFCAEMSLLRLIPEPYDRIIGISIYGELVQPDPSGHRPRTLHPCPLCREEADNDPRVAEWTRFFTFRPRMPEDPEQRHYYVREHMSFRALKKIHRDAANGCR